MSVIDGKAIAAQIRAEIKEAVIPDNPPGLAVVLVGENPASKVYVNMKGVACEDVGFHTKREMLPVDTPQKVLLEKIQQLNNDPAIHGILVQLPLPEHIDEQVIIQAINPKKDVDGFHPSNVGMLTIGLPHFIPCTPKGVLHMLKHQNIPLEGAYVVVVGRSNIVGKPLATLLSLEDATVTLCHAKTRDLASITKQADILVVAAGHPKLITADMVKENAVVIDVGVNRTEEGLVGDVDFPAVFPKVKAISPVPGGVGPMTVAMLLQNTLEAWRKAQ